MKYKIINIFAVVLLIVSLAFSKNSLFEAGWTSIIISGGLFVSAVILLIVNNINKS